MNGNIEDYWSRGMAAENFGISTQSLKKHEAVAAANGYGLSDDFYQIGNTKLWHRDEWNKLQAARLRKYIDEAVMLGLVVPTDQVEHDMTEEYRRGYDNGFQAGVESLAAEIPVVDNTHELNELEDVNATGYVVGGFQPLSSVGL